MFIATDAKQQRWNCLENIPMKKEGPFFCLLCGKEVRLKKGPVMRPHFAHINLEACPFHHETESPEHLELKLTLYPVAKQNSKACQPCKKVLSILVKIGAFISGSWT